MSNETRSYEKLVIYVLLGLGAAVWIGFGSLVFIGILQDAGA